jgi:hypothetical protein
VISPIPLDLALGSSAAVVVANARGFHDRLGTNPTAGKYVYIEGPAAHESWGWVRAEVISISTASNRMVVIPRQAGLAGRTAGVDGIPANEDDIIHFNASSLMTLEEIISLALDSGSVRRATAANAATVTMPLWGAAAELGQNFTDLRFRYFTRSGVEIPSPVSELAERLSIARIDVLAVGETAEPLSTGSRRRFALGLRVIPRNVRTD